MGNVDVAMECSIRKARKAQAGMAQKIIAEDKLPREIRLVAEVDAAYAGDTAFGAVAVLDYVSFEVLVSSNGEVPVCSNTVSFRELPVSVACIKKLKVQPDVFLVDGHGRAHPYDCGLASHHRLVLGKPTVGEAKSRLVGEPKQAGNDVFLGQEGEVVDAAVPTRKGADSVYVSVGNTVSLETAVKNVRHCAREAQVPEPILVTQKFASEERKAKMAPLTNRGSRRKLC